MIEGLSNHSLFQLNEKCNIFFNKPANILRLYAINETGDVITIKQTENE